MRISLNRKLSYGLDLFLGNFLKDLVAHRSSSMSSSASTASSSSSTSGLGSGGSSPVYHPHHHPQQQSPFGLPGAGGLQDADLLAAAAVSGLSFNPLAACAAAAQAQLAAAAAAAVQQQQQLPPLSPSQSPSFCSSVPSLSSSPPLSAGSNGSSTGSSHYYGPVNFYMEANHRLPVFWNLSPWSSKKKQHLFKLFAVKSTRPQHAYSTRLVSVLEKTRLFSGEI